MGRIMGRHAKTEKNFKKLNAEGLAAFFSRLGMTLRAGIPVQEGIGLMRGESDDALLEELGRLTMEEGLPLHAAMGRTGAFRQYAVGMIEVGEETGRLDGVCLSLSSYYDREASNRRRVKSTVMYPAVIISMMVAVILVLVIAVLPEFEKAYRALGSEMTGAARGFMAFGRNAGRILLAAFAAAAALALGGAAFGRTEKGAAFWRRFLEGFFVTRRLYEKMAVGRMAASVSLAVASGKNLEEALEMAEATALHSGVKGRIAACRAALLEGAGFAAAMEKSGLFTGIQANMIAIGVKTGQTDSVLENVSLVLDEEVDAATNNLISLIEPVLIALLSIIVGLILLSVLLPLMAIMNSAGI